MIVILGILGLAFLLFLTYSKENGKDANSVYEEELLKENEMAYYEMQETKQETSADIEIEETNQDAGTRLIRVLLMSTDYLGYYHDQIALTFNGEYMIQDGTQGMFAAGEQAVIGRDSAYFQDNHIALTPAENGSTITVTSITRAQGNPSYEGNLHIYLNEQGMWLVNELPLESYLTAVVPSEMPSYYAPEALKAQAVCARTYAAVQMQKAALEDFYADVDDSVSYQVYQNYGATEESIAAVEATANQIICQNGQPVDAYYFSTSHGKTSTNQVWNDAVPAAYLQSVECTYDEKEPWYRWEVVFSQEALLQAVRKTFSEIQNITGIEVLERDEADTAIHLQITADEKVYQVRNEYDIRSVLSPEELSIIRQDGSEVNGGKLLPSAYFTIETVENNGRMEYHIKGGGYGHGVGLSQNGARNMAENGSTYEEILHYFYKDVEILPWED